MTSSSLRARPVVDIEVVVPVYNDAARLAACIQTLRSFLDLEVPFSSLVTIVDHGSEDGTAIVAAELAATIRGVSAVSLPHHGRGNALRWAWSTSEARVVATMDVDLSVPLAAFLPLVAPLLSGHAQVSVGTRFARASRVIQGKPAFRSRTYHALLRQLLRSKVSDVQCGFTAVDRAVVDRVLSLVEDDQRFFDTEFMVTAERLGCRISEVPVDWLHASGARVPLAPTVLESLRGISRMTLRRSQTGRRTTVAPATSGDGSVVPIGSARLRASAS